MTSIGASLGELDVARMLALVLFFSAYFLVLEALFLRVARKLSARTQLNKRLSDPATPSEHLRELLKARNARGLPASGDFPLPAVWINQLLVQSGASWGIKRLPLVFIAIGGTILAGVLLLTGNFPAAVATGLLAGPVLFVVMLMHLRAKRLRKLEDQVPEAIETLVRSLRAGHPVPAAIGLVARQMPDPIGTEFRILADEFTYGLDLETAMNNMAARVGQEDLALLVIATGIQTGTGGNLAEILSGIAKVVRERLKLRLKVKAMSAEGRISALMLSLLPFAVFGFLWIVAPKFYGEVWDLPLVKPILAAAVCWLVIGNVVMYRMVKFKI